MMLPGKGFTRTIVELIEEHKKSSNVSLSPSLVEHAIRNKVLLQLLRTLDINDSLREKQERGYAVIVNEVERISHALKGLSYAFFKLVKPLSYVPADVDLLVDVSQVKSAAHEIMGLGYRVAVKDPYCLTLTRGDSIVDLYVHPSLGGVIIINGQKLLEHSCTMEFNGAEIRSLEGYAEALVAASHAIYKERIYTLNDYFTVEKWTSEKTIRLARELKCKEALKTAIELNRKIGLGMLETPYKIPLPTWLAMLIRKFQIDGLTRASSIGMLKTLTSKRAGMLLASKLMRETY